MKKHSFLGIDFLYALTGILFILVFMKGHHAVVDDTYLYYGWMSLSAGIVLAFPRFIAQIVNSAFLSYSFAIVVGRFKNLYSIYSILIGLFFILVYIVIKYVFFKGKYSPVSWKLRIFGILCLPLAIAFSNAYVNQIDDVGNQIYQLTETDYYDYYHINNKKEYINKFGTLSYIYRNLSDKFDDNSLQSEFEEINAFINRNETLEKNEYTGVFSGNTLVLIQATDLYNCFVSKELTPTLYMMKKNGYFISSFGNQASYCVESDSEFMTNLSLYPLIYTSQYLYDDESLYDETLARLFEDNGYMSLMGINNYEVYHNREKMAEVYGYENLLSPMDVGLNAMATNDSMLEGLSWFASQESTFLFYSAMELTSVPEEYRTRILEYYPDASDELVLKIYNMMDLDEGLAKLLYYAEFYGALDNVVFMVYGAQGAERSSDSEIYQYATNNDKNSIGGLYIYKNGIEHVSFKKCGSSLDLLPTIANLWGFDLDNSRIIGRDVFDEDYNGMQLVPADMFDYWYSNTGKYRFKEIYTYYREECQQMRERMRFSYLWLKDGKKYLEEK